MPVKIDGKEYATVPEMSAALAEFIRARTFTKQQEDHCQNGCPSFKDDMDNEDESRRGPRCCVADSEKCPAVEKVFSVMISAHLDPKEAERKARKLYREVPTSTIQEIHEVAADIQTKTFARHAWNCRGCEFYLVEDSGVKCEAPAPTWCPRSESVLNDLIRRARGVYRDLEEPR